MIKLYLLYVHCQLILAQSSLSMSNDVDIILGNTLVYYQFPTLTISDSWFWHPLSLSTLCNLDCSYSHFKMEGYSSPYVQSSHNYHTRGINQLLLHSVSLCFCWRLHGLNDFPQSILQSRIVLFWWFLEFALRIIYTYYLQ